MLATVEGKRLFQPVVAVAGRADSVQSIADVRDGFQVVGFGGLIGFVGGVGELLGVSRPFGVELTA